MAGARVESLGSWLIRARLFVVSYAPLAAIFAARAAPHWLWSGILAAVTIVGFVDGFRLVRGTARKSSHFVTVETVEDQGNAVSGYLATYLLPFLGTMPSSIGDGVAYGFYFATAFVVYAKSNLALVNPTLYVLGWRIYRATLHGRSTLLVTRRLVRSGDSVTVTRLLDIYVEKEQTET
jgi:hypothetical protein